MFNSLPWAFPLPKPLAALRRGASAGTCSFSALADALLPLVLPFVMPFVLPFATASSRGAPLPFVATTSSCSLSGGLSITSTEPTAPLACAAAAAVRPLSFFALGALFCSSSAFRASSAFAVASSLASLFFPFFLFASICMHLAALFPRKETLWPRASAAAAVNAATAGSDLAHPCMNVEEAVPSAASDFILLVVARSSTSWWARKAGWWPGGATSTCSPRWAAQPSVAASHAKSAAWLMPG
mmetsp:Transcript_42221/g.99111  ORF Transcript_42221/g.99111 Transcript_42221/m.99111 type:complete len:242 (+) Transcript_42221:2299-3024(+)